MTGPEGGKQWCMLALAALMLTPTAGQAAAYFECRDAQGGILFSDLPCPDPETQAEPGLQREVMPDNKHSLRARGRHLREQVRDACH